MAKTFAEYEAEITPEFEREYAAWLRSGRGGLTVDSLEAMKDLLKGWYVKGRLAADIIAELPTQRSIADAEQDRCEALKKAARALLAEHTLAGDGLYYRKLDRETGERIQKALAGLAEALAPHAEK